MGRRRDSGDYFADGLPDDGTPVDIAAVRRDDALIDAVAGDGPVETQSPEEYELATLLADWRAEILAEPLPAGPDFDEVVAAVNREVGAREALATQRTSPASLRLIRPIAGAAALVAVALGGGAVVSYSAEPGDPLWGVKQVVFSEQAQSTVARIDTTSTLQRAEELIAEGNADQAQVLLQSAQERSSAVTDEGQRDELGDWLRRLTAELDRIGAQWPPVPGLPVPPPPAPPAGSGAASVPATTVPQPPSTTDALVPDPTTGPTTPDPTIMREVPDTDTVEPTTPTVEPTTPNPTTPSTTVPSPTPTTTASAPSSTSTTSQGQSVPQDLQVDPSTSSAEA